MAQADPISSIFPKTRLAQIQNHMHSPHHDASSERSIYWYNTPQRLVQKCTANSNGKLHMIEAFVFKAMLGFAVGWRCPRHDECDEHCDLHVRVLTLMEYWCCNLSADLD